MDPTYKAVSEFAQTWGLVYFVVIFAARAALRIVALAQSSNSIDDARIPLRED